MHYGEMRAQLKVRVLVKAIMKCSASVCMYVCSTMGIIMSTSAPTLYHDSVVLPTIILPSDQMAFS